MSILKIGLSSLENSQRRYEMNKYPLPSQNSQHHDHRKSHKNHKSPKAAHQLSTVNISDSQSPTYLSPHLSAYLSPPLPAFTYYPHRPYPLQPPLSPRTKTPRCTAPGSYHPPPLVTYDVLYVITSDSTLATYRSRKKKTRVHMVSISFAGYLSRWI